MRYENLQAGSLGRRLLIQLLIVAGILSALLYLAVRSVANQAAEASHNNILGASATARAEQLGSGSEGINIDIPYSAFSMLGAISDDRVFYRIDTDDITATGYEDLPLPASTPTTSKPTYYSALFRGTPIRAAAQLRVIPINDKPVSVLILVAQTQQGQNAITSRVANTAAALGIGFFLVAGTMSWLATRSTVKPLYSVANAIGRRGAHDLRPLRSPVPSELTPLVDSLNDFISRLRGTLNRTETFMAEAAHHIRTPLATVRAQAEIALRQAETNSSRKTLRTVIRAVDESSRSASQLLDHAMISYRSDQLSLDAFDYTELVQDVVNATSAIAELKDLEVNTILEPNLQLVGDRVLIEVALNNLMDNAIKYSAPDSTIDVQLTQTDSGIRCDIRDAGRGLSGLSQSSLSERFKRGENVKDVVGSGLGLTMVEAIASAHDGHFSITENPGGGTCATLLL